MNKETIKSLCEEQKKLRKIMQKASQQKENAPEGVLVVLRRKSGKNEYYLERKENGIRKREYLNSQKIECIRALAQKKYSNKLIALAEKKYIALNAFLEKYPVDELKEVVCTVPDGVREFVTPIILDDSSYIADWYKRNPGNMNSYPQSHLYKTNRGENVRSKSEKIIADIFDKYNIPYVYEVLRKGSEQAREVAAKTLSEVKSAMKINYFDSGVLSALIAQQEEKYK